MTAESHDGSALITIITFAVGILTGAMTWILGTICVTFCRRKKDEPMVPEPTTIERIVEVDRPIERIVEVGRPIVTFREVVVPSVHWHWYYWSLLCIPRQTFEEVQSSNGSWEQRQGIQAICALQELLQGKTMVKCRQLREMMHLVEERDPAYAKCMIAALCWTVTDIIDHNRPIILCDGLTYLVKYFHSDLKITSDQNF